MVNPDEDDSESDGAQAPVPPTELETADGFEDRFRRLLSDMGCSDVGGGRSFTLGGHQIDACAGIGDRLFLFDCTIRRGTRASTKQLRRKIQQWRGISGPIIAGAKANPQYGKYAEFSLVVAAYANISPADVEYGLGDAPTVHILSRQNIDYLNEISDDIGVYARYRLPALLGVSIQRKSGSVPAVRISRDGTHLYLFAAPARELAELAFVPQVEAGFREFYQRLIKKGKIRAISDYVTTLARPFPNSVVLAVSPDMEPQFHPFRKDADQPSNETAMAMGTLDLPPTYGAFWVIDGQHRIYGSALSPSPPVLAAALVPATDLEKAKYFLDINSEQTKINSDLKWDLRARLTPDQAEGKISAAVQLLDNPPGPLAGRIKIPHRGSGKSRPIKLSGLSDAVLRNRLHETLQYSWKEEGFVHNLAHDLNTWLSQVDSEIGSTEVKRRFLLDNGGLSVLVVIFKRIAKKEEHHRPTLARLSIYAKALAAWASTLSAKDASGLAKRAASEGGRAEVADLAVSALNEQLPADQQLELSGHVTKLSDDIKAFEASLRAALTLTFERKVGPDWLDKCNLQQAGRGAPEPSSLTLGQLRSILQRDAFWATVSSGFDDINIKREHGLNLLAYVIDYRNAVEHGRLQEAKRFDSRLVETSLRSLRTGFGIGPD